MRRTFSCVAAVLVVMGLSSYLYGQTPILIDDFEDLDLDGWTLADQSADQPWGPGVYDPSSAELRIYHSGGMVPAGTHFTQSAMFALWNQSAVDPMYSEGYLRAKIKTNEVQNSTSIVMRGDLANATGYLLFGATAPSDSYPGFDGGLSVSKFKNGAEEGLWNSKSVGIEYLPGEYWNVELGAVGARITAKVWKVGDPEPTTPQFDWVDPDPITSGMIAISSDVYGAVNPIAARGDATFDDIWFLVPEPTSWVLLLAGVLTVACVRRLR